MKKLGLLFVCCALLFCMNALAEDYPGARFVVRSDLDLRYIQVILKNADAYQKNIQSRYSLKIWQPKPIIYYSEKQSDTQQLLDNKGYKIKVEQGFYEPDTSAIYTHRLMNNGELNGWNGLFHEIARHLIDLNYSSAPPWFKEGLACFLGEQTQITDGKLTIGVPKPSSEKMLRNEIEQDHRPNVKRLFSTSEEVQFHEWNMGCHFARAFFYWLHKTGRLKEYLKNAQEKGYSLEVLEETLSLSYSEINVELIKFIKNECYAGACMQDGLDAHDKDQKIQAFLKALELKPDYYITRLELAECYYRSGDYKSCRDNLEPILNDPEIPQYRQAAELMANIYYKKKDYNQALDYFNKAWKHSDYYAYQYRLAYQIGNCFYQTQDRFNAKKWYKKFLDGKWEKNDMKANEDFVRKYIELIDTSKERPQKREKKTQNSPEVNP